MEKGEREVRERKGRSGRRGEGEKGAMGVDPTKFGKKSMPVFIRLQYIISNIKTIGLLPAAYNV